MKINIIAPNIKNGGGLELLIYLIDYLKIHRKDLFCMVYVDSSLSMIKSSESIEVIPMHSSIEKIKLFSKKTTNSLYFGNLPPLVKSENSVVYFHNTYLLMPLDKLKNSSFKMFVKYFLQQIYIKYFIKNVDLVACQNEDIQSKFIDKYNFNKVDLYPFFRLCNRGLLKEVKKEFDFCYVSLAHPHKNHKRLLEACEVLSKENINFSIALTIEEGNSDLIAKIEEINNQGIVKIVNLGKISKEEVCKLYAKSRSLIFPSTEETFGLALVEAVNMDLDVLASDLYYTYQSIKPSLVFDPLDTNSITISMKKYLTTNVEKSKVKIENKIENLIKILTKEKNV